MFWMEFIQKYRNLLEMYFTNTCTRCIYREVMYIDTNIYLEDAVLNYEVMTEVYKPNSYKYALETLCVDCLLDKSRDLEDVLFEILKHTLEDEKTSDKEFYEILQILNETNIIHHPKELLFIHYVNRCKYEHAVTPVYKVAIIKLLKLGIDVNYTYSHVRYEDIFIIFPGRVINEGCNNTTLELCHILNDHGYSIIYLKNGLTIMSKIGRFLIIG